VTRLLSLDLFKTIHTVFHSTQYIIRITSVCIKTGTNPTPDGDKGGFGAINIALTEAVFETVLFITLI